MGSHATTRIANATDYIEAHTRWDGFGNEIREYLSHPESGWNLSIAEFRKRLSQNKQGTQNLDLWLNQLEAFIDNTVKNPSVDTVMALLCMISFNRHQVLPHCTSNKDLLRYWGEGHPDYVGVLNHEKNPDGISFADLNPYDDEDEKKEPSDKNLAPLVDYDIDTPVIARKIEPQYKVARIYTIENTEQNDNENNPDKPEKLKINHNEYIDVKFTGLTEEEFTQQILALPYFWRDLYTIGKSKKEVLRDQNNLWRGKGIFQFMLKLKDFYSPTSDYDLFSHLDNPTEIMFSNQEREDNIRAIFERMYSLIPFDFFITAMTTHLFIALPGQVLPVTQAEIKAGYDVDMYIGVKERRESTIYVHVTKLNYEEHRAIFKDFAQNITQRQTTFLEQHQIKSIVPGASPQYGFKGVNIQSDTPDSPTQIVPFINFRYEVNLIFLMDSQRDIEILAKEKEKEE
jgi:hypothetical protein